MMPLRTLSSEYETTSRRLGDSEVLDEDLEVLYSQRSSPIFDIVSKLLGELPLVCSLLPFSYNCSNLTSRIPLFSLFFAFSALAYPTKLSLDSIAILQQSSGALRSSLEVIFRTNEKFRKSVPTVRKMYEAFLIMNSMSDGTLAYPPVSKKGDGNLNGMSFEVRYIDSSHHHVRCVLTHLQPTRSVSFSYPGSQTATPALNNVSMSINPGQQVGLRKIATHNP